MLTFKNFVTLKKPIVLLLNNSDNKNSQKIKDFFKNKKDIKIYDKSFDQNKILSLNPKLVIDINDDKKTKGIYVNCSRNILDRIKKILLTITDIPFIGKKQINANKKFELSLFKRGVNYIYIEFPIYNIDKKTTLKTQLVIIKKIINNYLYS